MGCGGLGLHKSAPFGVAEEGDDGVNGVEDGVEGAVLVDAKAHGDGVDGYPRPPLLDVLTGKHPHCHYAEGRGEGVEKGHCTVGARQQPSQYGTVDGREYGQCGQSGAPRDMRYGQRGPLAPGGASATARATRPHGVAVDGYGEVVDVHGEIGVQPCSVVNPKRQDGHCDVGKPHSRVGVVLPVQVEQPDEQSEHFDGAVEGEELYDGFHRGTIRSVC